MQLALSLKKICFCALFERSLRDLPTCGGVREEKLGGSQLLGGFWGFVCWGGGDLVSVLSSLSSCVHLSLLMLSWFLSVLPWLGYSSTSLEPFAGGGNSPEMI